MNQRNDVEKRLARVQHLAGLLDDKYRIPGTKIRFGMDNVVGLMPGIGDAATAIAGLWLVAEAYRMKAPWSILIKMGFNIVVDSTLGVVPIIGDLFDLYWKSNRRNAKLLESFLTNRPQRPG